MSNTPEIVHADQQLVIPSYLVERGDSARQYRRRLSINNQVGLSRNRSNSLASVNVSSYEDQQSALNALNIYFGNEDRDPEAYSAQPTTTNMTLNNYSPNAEFNSILTEEPHEMSISDEYISIHRPREISITAGHRFGIDKPKIVNL